MSATVISSPQWGGSQASEIIQLAREAARAFFSFSSLLAQLTFALLRPLLMMLQPLAWRGVSAFWRRFTSQSPRAIALQVSASIACISLAWLERRYGYGAHALTLCRRFRATAAQRYLELLATVRAQSLIAAAVLPHVLFFLVAILVEYMLSHLLPNLSRAPLFFVAACARPALRTIALVYVLESAPLRGVTPGPTRIASASSSDSDDDSADATGSSSRGSSMGALSALRRRATLVAERIANARSSSSGSSDDDDGVSTASDVSDDGEKRLVKAESMPAFSGSGARTLPATGLARRPRTSFNDAEELAA
eukprot:IDg10175t1